MSEQESVSNNTVNCRIVKAILHRNILAKYWHLGRNKYVDECCETTSSTCQLKTYSRSHALLLKFPITQDMQQNLLRWSLNKNFYTPFIEVLIALKWFMVYFQCHSCQLKRPSCIHLPTSMKHNHAKWKSFQQIMQVNINILGKKCKWKLNTWIYYGTQHQQASKSSECNHTTEQPRKAANFLHLILNQLAVISP